MNYSWPGNIRELQHLIERHALLSKEKTIRNIELPEIEILPNEAPPSNPEPSQTVELEKQYILDALKKSNGKISGKGGAAELLNIACNTFNAKMKKLGISRTYQ